MERESGIHLLYVIPCMSPMQMTSLMFHFWSLSGRIQWSYGRRPRMVFTQWDPLITSFWRQLLTGLTCMLIGEWNLLWRLNVPGKIKIFLWRVCRECLPIRYNLQRRGVQCPLSCVLCSSKVENCWHSFLMCPVSLKYWSCVKLWDKIADFINEVESFARLLFKVLAAPGDEERKLFV